MPFTPFHMGPGLLVKSLLQGSFSLMVFGWAQVVMDIQPLVVMLTGEGHLHGFSHTYIGAILLAVLAALSGKYLAIIGLYILGLNKDWALSISWRVALLSAFIGTFSHIVLDSVMHSDIEPFFPLTHQNFLLGLLSVQMLHNVCLYSGLLGGALYFIIHWQNRKNKHNQ